MERLAITVSTWALTLLAAWAGVNPALAAVALQSFHNARFMAAASHPAVDRRPQTRLGEAPRQPPDPIPARRRRWAWASATRPVGGLAGAPAAWSAEPASGVVSRYLIS